jgi:beta-lactamase superfamily II metal-dependent hydrolase
VLGEGIGESIILELPNGKWGVVDCYARFIQNETTNQTLNFLKQRNVQALEFLCLSHPHEDHFRGITHLLKAYDGKLKEFYLFPAWNWKIVKNILAHLRTIAEKSKEPVNLDSAIQREGVDELDSMFQIIGRLQRYGNLRIRLTEDFKPLYNDVVEFEEENAQLKIFSLAPAGNLVYAYQQAIEKSLTDEQEFVQTYYPKHNLISSVLLLKYGETTVVLGGDAEKQSWNYILNDELRIKEGVLLRSHLVKVSHHGSSNGLTENLWETLTEGRECYAVITPFQSKRLPEKQTLSAIVQHTREIFVTSLKALTFWPWEEKCQEYLLRQWVRRIPSARVISFSSGEICRCSFSFDAYGTCLGQEFEGTAGLIP